MLEQNGSNYLRSMNQSEWVFRQHRLRYFSLRWIQRDASNRSTTSLRFRVPIGFQLRLGHGAEVLNILLRWNPYHPNEVTSQELLPAL